MIKLEQLRYLLELNKTESFRQCAERLHCSQPAVSLAIKNLEKELGVELFTRTASSVQLTEAGKRVAKQARDIWSNVADIYMLAKEENIEKSVQGREKIDKEIAFYAPETTLSSILPMVLLRLQKHSLQMKIATIESKPELTLQALAENPNAIGLHYFWEEELALLQEKRPQLHVQPICELHYFLVVTDCATFEVADAIQLEEKDSDAVPFPLVIYGRSGNITWDVMDALVDDHNAELVFKAPEEKMFFNYIKQGFAAGLIMQYGETKPLKRHANREQYRFIPLETHRHSYFCCMANK